MKALAGALGSTLVVGSAVMAAWGFVIAIGPASLDWSWRVTGLALYLLFAAVTARFAYDVGEFYDVVAARLR